MQVHICENYVLRLIALAKAFREENSNQWNQGGWVLVCSHYAFAWHANPSARSVPLGTFAVHESGAIIAATAGEVKKWVVPHIMKGVS